MSALVFLGIAVAVSVLGCSVLWFKTRQPRSMDAHIREFSKELQALAPDHPAGPAGRRYRPRHESERGRDR